MKRREFENLSIGDKTPMGTVTEFSLHYPVLSSSVEIDGGNGPFDRHWITRDRWNHLVNGDPDKRPVQKMEELQLC